MPAKFLVSGYYELPKEHTTYLHAWCYHNPDAKYSPSNTLIEAVCGLHVTINNNGRGFPVVIMYIKPILIELHCYIKHPHFEELYRRIGQVHNKRSLFKATLQWLANCSIKDRMF